MIDGVLHPSCSLPSLFLLSLIGLILWLALATMVETEPLNVSVPPLWSVRAPPSSFRLLQPGPPVCTWPSPALSHGGDRGQRHLRREQSLPAGGAGTADPRLTRRGRPPTYGAEIPWLFIRQWQPTVSIFHSNWTTGHSINAYRGLGAQPDSRIIQSLEPESFQIKQHEDLSPPERACGAGAHATRGGSWERVSYRPRRFLPIACSLQGGSRIQSENSALNVQDLYASGKSNACLPHLNISELCQPRSSRRGRTMGRTVCACAWVFVCACACLIFTQFRNSWAQHLGHTYILTSQNASRSTLNLVGREHMSVKRKIKGNSKDGGRNKHEWRKTSK